MIEKRGKCVCVIHAHPKKKGSKTDKEAGTPIKCFCGKDPKTNMKKAQAMHYAIVQSQKKKK